MKKLALLAIACAALGCHKSEFDVSPAQVTAKGAFKGPGGLTGLPDLKHLPPGAVKHEMTFKKGDRLPDGSIADGDRKVFRIELPKGSIHGLPDGGEGKRVFETDDVVKKP